MFVFLERLNPFILQSCGHVPANVIYKRGSALRDSRDWSPRNVDSDYLYNKTEPRRDGADSILKGYFP